MSLTKYCTKCGRVLRMEGDYGYCTNCQIRFHIPQVLPSPQRKYCTKCGSVLRMVGDYGYCDRCMLKFQIPQTQTVDKSTNLPARPTAAVPTKTKKLRGARGKEILFPDWYISISFSKSRSENYPLAVALAKSAPQYHEQMNDSRILHQAIYSSKPNEYLAFVRLYELVGGWKSSFVFINGTMIDRKIVQKLNYCYGDNCRSGNSDFCFGASYMTDNPFGCHRFQISACNNPWWSFYVRNGKKYYLDKNAIYQRINSYANVYNICPLFDYNYAIKVLNALPAVVSERQLAQIVDGNYKIKIH